MLKTLHENTSKKVSTCDECDLSLAPTMSTELDYVSTLKPEILDKAKQDFGEDDFLRRESVQALREWLKKQPHLQNAPTGF